MNVSATYKGAVVNFVDITRNGSTTYLTYVDSSNVLKTDVIHTPTTSATSIATGATVN